MPLLILLIAFHVATVGLLAAKIAGRLPQYTWWVIPAPTFLSWGLAGTLAGTLHGPFVLLAAIAYGGWAWMKTPKVRI